MDDYAKGWQDGALWALDRVVEIARDGDEIKKALAERLVDAAEDHDQETPRCPPSGTTS